MPHPSYISQPTTVIAATEPQSDPQKIKNILGESRTRFGPPFCCVSCYDSTISAQFIVQVEANGINSITTSAIQVYPNPTNDVLHIDNLVETTSFQILNIVGQCVQQGIMQAGNNTIATQALPSGIYMLVMTDVQGRRSIIRLVKE